MRSAIDKSTFSDIPCCKLFQGIRRARWYDRHDVICQVARLTDNDVSYVVGPSGLYSIRRPLALCPGGWSSGSLRRFVRGWVGVCTGRLGLIVTVFVS